MLKFIKLSLILITFKFNELPRPKGTRYQAEENLIFSLMKTIGFQTFLLTTDASVGEFFRLKNNAKAFISAVFRRNNYLFK